MNASLFGSLNQLDVAFLDEAYANDAETASYVFQLYLDELPTNIDLLQESLKNRDIERFSHLIHKQKPGYSYVGLTDISNRLQELQIKCVTVNDLQVYENEIDDIMKIIQSSSVIIGKAVLHLQQFKRA
jgi:HPt (histidine-containing phosphotransfer) domain-containing protein